MTNSILTKTAIAFATALTLGSATAALANDIDESPSTAQSTREWAQYLKQTQKAPSHNAGTAFGFYQGGTQKVHQSR